MLKQDDPTLSVAVIAKNEEADLPGFLENFSVVADEIIIIDDDSTDRTGPIVRAFDGPTVYINSPMDPDRGFSGQREKGLEVATGDWVLQVDCDMRLTAELALEIREAIRDGDKTAYKFGLRQFFLGRECRYGGFQYWNQPWLCRRGAMKWSQKLHERANISAPTERIGQLQHKMIHLNDHDFSERLRKNHQYSHLEAERLLGLGRPITLWHLITQPIWRSFRSYVLMRGFLDGRIGLVWAFYQFTGTATAYFLAWDHLNRVDRVAIDKAVNACVARAFNGQRRNRP